MTLTNIKQMKSEKGFTIVELLIVIVVIGILAAIVIVAYNGVQNRAKDAKYQTDANALLKLAEAVNADLGSYPSGTDSATLTTAMNASSTSSIPQNVAVTYLAAAGAAPANATALTAANATTRTYTVKVCAAAPNSTGLTIYYPSNAAGAIQTIKAGTGC